MSLSVFEFNWSSIQNITCNECNKNICRTGDICRDRADHYVRYTDAVHTCPVCLVTLPTTCAIVAHLRIHLKIPPFICPHCGQTLSESMMSYPFAHSCEGFTKMRDSSSFNCSIQNCNKLILPDEIKNHFKTHLLKVYQCKLCSIMWSTEVKTICKKNNDNMHIVAPIGFHCPLCKSFFFSETNEEEHFNLHYDELCKQWNVEIYPCSVCHIIYQDIKSLLNHHIAEHSASSIRNILTKLLVVKSSVSPQSDIFYIRTCKNCLNSYTYQSTMENINLLKNLCPFGCLKKKEPFLQCYICKMKISKKWDNVKRHFAVLHTEHKCLDLKLKLSRIDSNSYYTKTPNVDDRTGNLKNELEEPHTSQVKNELVQTGQNPSEFIEKIEIDSDEEDLSKVEITVPSDKNDESVQTDNLNVCQMEIDTNINRASNKTNEADDVVNFIIVGDSILSLQSLGIPYLEGELESNIQVHDDKNDVMIVEDNASLKENNESPPPETLDCEMQIDTEVNGNLNEEDGILLSDDDESVVAVESLDENEEQNNIELNDVLIDLTGEEDTSENAEELNNDEEQPKLKCTFCDFVCNVKVKFEVHLITHREPDMAYQCLECGMSFAARTLFALHLLVVHQIRKTQKYITSKPCFNESARNKYLYNSFFPPEDDDIEKNQCHVCREKFDNAVDYASHVRVHGLPFLMSLRRKKQVDPNLYEG